MHIDGGQIKSAQMTMAKESQNFVPFDLVIQKTTIVEYLGRYEPRNTERSDERPAQEILFEDVMQADGPIIVRGFIKTKFTALPFGGSTYGCGSVTDGNYKITVQVASYTTINFEKGIPVTVEGELKKNVPCTIVCQDSTFVKLDPTIEEPMSTTQLLQGAKTPKRKDVSQLDD
ncbi:hypothetical protein TKK_0011507 [Trichogramma kaykai]|uniref:Uncharacterized protein n=1 Tax=Trichogramma kaykai TaxID=54128 RepID=A0ABD2WRB2_9HYME